MAALLGVGLELGIGKSIDNDTVFLGMRAIFPSIANNTRLLISLSIDRIMKIVAILNDILANRSAPHSMLECLAGKLWFAQTAIYHRFARSMHQPLYKKTICPEVCTMAV